MARPSPSVLIVDDSVGVCTAVAMMLEEDGFTVQIAHNLSNGRNEALKRNFNLAIIDVTLGRDSGFELARQILSANARYKIILTSGLYDLSAGFDDYPELKSLPVLLKPFGRDGLLECVRRTLDEAAA